PALRLPVQVAGRPPARRRRLLPVELPDRALERVLLQVGAVEVELAARQQRQELRQVGEPPDRRTGILGRLERRVLLVHARTLPGTRRRKTRRRAASRYKLPGGHARGQLSGHGWRRACGEQLA